MGGEPRSEALAGLALAAGEVGRPAVRVYRLAAAKAAPGALLRQQPLPGEEQEEALVYFGWSGLGTPTPPPGTSCTS